MNAKGALQGKGGQKRQGGPVRQRVLLHRLSKGSARCVLFFTPCAPPEAAFCRASYPQIFPELIAHFAASTGAAGGLPVYEGVNGLVGGFEEAVVIDASSQSKSGEVEAQGFVFT